MKFLRVVLVPLIPIYWLIISIRNWFFDIGIFKTKKVQAKVISIGNLTVGGSGKTPAVIYLASLLKGHNINVGVLSRGYGRKSSGYLLVSNKTKTLVSVEECGDEIYHTAIECKVPAAVAENRVMGAERFISETGINCIVLDDAFQHRWIDRNMNILIFEQRILNSTKLFEKTLLPSGIMREPLKSIKRADTIIINRKFSPKLDISASLKKHLEHKKIFTAYYEAINFVDVTKHLSYSISEFEGQKSLLISGIANPFSFINALKQTKVDTENRMIFRDHKDYTLKEIQQIRKKFYSTNSHSVVTTEKDAVKLSKFYKELDDIDIYYLKIELKFDDSESFNKYIFERLNLNY